MGSGWNRMTSADLSRLVDRVPEGWTLVEYDGRRYGLTRTTRAGGASVAVFAEQLGGTEVVSANLYRTSAGDLLKPCEMPADVVLAFLRGWVPVKQPQPRLPQRCGRFARVTPRVERP